MKPLLSVDDQIEHLKKKGVTFNIYDENYAKHYLTNHNNYFKLAAYRKNYDKHPDGRENELQCFKHRMLRNIDYYNKNDLIKSSFVFLKLVIDKWYPSNVQCEHVEKKSLTFFAERHCACA